VGVYEEVESQELMLVFLLPAGIPSIKAVEPLLLHSAFAGQATPNGELHSSDPPLIAKIPHQQKLRRAHD